MTDGAKPYTKTKPKRNQGTDGSALLYIEKIRLSFLIKENLSRDLREVKKMNMADMGGQQWGQGAKLSAGLDI